MAKLNWSKAKTQPAERFYDKPRRGSPPKRKTVKRHKPGGRPQGERINPTDKEVAWLKKLREQTPFLDQDIALKIKARAQDARARGKPLTPLNKVQIETKLRQSAVSKIANGDTVGLAWVSQRVAEEKRPRVPLWKQIEERQQAQQEANKAFAEAVADLMS